MSTATGKKAILLPVKAFSQAKARLAPLLSGEERQELMWAFFQDAAKVLNECRQADCIALVSSERRALRAARQEGWMVLAEDSQSSESRSVDDACSSLRQRGFQAALRLPVDIPWLLSRDVDQLLGADRPSSAIVVPSRDGSGTNALLRNPPDAFPSCFGPDSLRRHLQAAAQARLTACVVENKRLALDLDTPEDLLAFLQQPVAGHTLNLLQEINIMGRLSR